MGDFYCVPSQLSSGDASDSICPKGWGMAGRDGNGSYQRLIIDIYNGNKKGVVTLKYSEYSIQIAIGLLVNNKPLSLVRSGSSEGYRNTDAFMQESKVIKLENAFYSQSLRAGEARLRPQDNANKGFGYSVRCVAKSNFY